ncbi:hypothetical protein X742_16050 [Mesorhizobium sp. LNHC232B00]|nr:hypothetical protein X742_16050 [Mesorhizobium sp. LNHC232B00]
MPRKIPMKEPLSLCMSLFQKHRATLGDTR